MNSLDRLVLLLTFGFAAAALLLSLWSIYLVMRAHARIDAGRRGRGAYTPDPERPQRSSPPPPAPRPAPQPAAEEPPTGPIQPATGELESGDAPTQQLRAQRPRLPRPGEL